MNELNISWRTAKHSEGTTVPARVIISLPAVPKYTEYYTWFLAVRVLLRGIQLFITTYNIILNLANTVQFLCGQVMDFPLRQTKRVVFSVKWRNWPKILQIISFHGWTALIGLWLLYEVPWSHSYTPHWVGVPWTGDRPVARTSTW